MAGARTFESLGLMGLTTQGPAPDGRTEIGKLAVDSRQVKPGDLFIAIPGTERDGAAFAQYAVRQGAAAVLATAAGVETARSDLGDLRVPFFVTETPRAALSRLAARYYARQPAVMAAVTGTNGKTSTAHFLRQIWAHAGLRAAAFGTTGVEGEGFDEPLSHTTPEPITLHALLARLDKKGCTHAAMEASSHGLAQHRLDGVRLAAAGFTNISRDHMEYHATHADYVAAKLRLFDTVLPAEGTMVVNAMDAQWPKLRAVQKARGIAMITVGTGGDVDLLVSQQSFRGDGQDATFTWKGEAHRVALNLVGAFQAENVAISAGLALATGLEPEQVFAALAHLSGVKGRMELAARRQNGAAIYVDYSHTPDALVTAIAALRPHCTGRLITVFGAGGDRDPGKRPMMGKAVAEGADHAIITDDNPRSEDPASIRAAIKAACPEGEEIGDRAEAILAGVDALRAPGDCLLIAGKGHEQGQIVGAEIL
ncbi:MAG: UDP-N-acetylmuramoyl-L-alanyl-D-glutamate--2,6-diaminopimelate ligase, partial [Pseudomonadota bacterium]